MGGRCPQRAHSRRLRLRWVSTCSSGNEGGVYFRVYGKRLEQAHTQHHRQHTPPFKEVGRRAVGVWLTKRRRGENTNLLLSGGLQSLREPRTCHSPDGLTCTFSAPSHLAAPRATAGAGASLRVSPVPRFGLSTSQKLAGQGGRGGGGFFGNVGT